MSAVKAVIFDMDGVLVDTEPIHKEAWKVLMAGKDVSLPASVLRGCVGMPDDEFAEELVRDGILEGRAGVWLEEKRRVYLDLLKERLVPHHGVEDTLRAFRGRYRMSIASSAFGKSVRAIVSQLGWRDYFEHITVREDVIRCKPDPEIYELAVKKLELSPGDCVAVEDSLVGLAAAVGAGVATVAVTTSFTADELSAADVCLESLAELPGIIEEMKG